MSSNANYKEEMNKNLVDREFTDLQVLRLNISVSKLGALYKKSQRQSQLENVHPTIQWNIKYDSHEHKYETTCDQLFVSYKLVNNDIALWDISAGCKCFEWKYTRTDKSLFVRSYTTYSAIRCCEISAMVTSRGWNKAIFWFVK